VEFFTPEFWKNYAKKRKAEFQTSKVATKKIWEEMAHFYKDFEKEKSYEEIKKIPIEYLENQRIFNKPITIADICCGPGTHAIEFSKRAKKVFALDISQSMIDSLKQKSKKYNIKNISVKCNDFFKEDFREKFDLVFVSMSPILNELDSIDKLLLISNRYLFISFWAGKRKNDIFEKCYKAIFNRNFKWDILDITIIFNYLYSLGYSPAIFYKNSCWENKYNFEKIFQHVLWHLKFYKDELTENEKEKVKEIIKATDSFKTYIRIGFLFLDKEESCKRI